MISPYNILVKRFLIIQIYLINHQDLPGLKRWQNILKILNTIILLLNDDDNKSKVYVLFFQMFNDTSYFSRTL